jgi:hypothetical protein
MAYFIDLLGKRYGRLLTIDYARNGGRVYWHCQCDCGKETYVRADHLSAGTTVSCGCFRTELSTSRVMTHGMKYTRVYRIWESMKSRCSEYSDYASRGIKVCERWSKFENFYADMGDPPDGMSIYRFPNTDGDYEPGNCRWATRSCYKKESTCQ